MRVLPSLGALHPLHLSLRCTLFVSATERRGEQGSLSPSRVEERNSRKNREKRKEQIQKRLRGK
jgi:hypothetical protein